MVDADLGHRGLDDRWLVESFWVLGVQAGHGRGAAVVDVGPAAVMDGGRGVALEAGVVVLVVVPVHELLDPVPGLLDRGEVGRVGRGVLGGLEQRLAVRVVVRDPGPVAGDLDAQLVALHVVELPLRLVPDVTIAVPGEPDRLLSVVMREDAERNLQWEVERATAARPVRVARRVVNGRARDEILREAEQWRFDLIVLSTRGRGATPVATRKSEVVRARRTP